ncbi:hypothetical protein [Sporosarcina sp. A2]|uniref:hypothetical protein n=1 Tax=Sporosarcina sp. A2 TaxID=3393449 RepID=UPI003D7B070F
MKSSQGIYPKVLKICNSNLKAAEEEKRKIFKEVLREDSLAVILRMNLFAEVELKKSVKVLLADVNIGDKLINHLNFLHDLQIMDKDLYEAVKKLNTVRNNLAHKLQYGNKDDIVYSDLKSSLSGSILKGHKIDVEMQELIHGKLNDGMKIRILLAGVWIQLKIFTTSILLKKYEFAKRLLNEVEEEIRE